MHKAALCEPKFSYMAHVIVRAELLQWAVWLEQMSDVSSNVVQ